MTKYRVKGNTFYHQFEVGEVVTKTDKVGMFTGNPVYKNEEGLEQSMHSVDIEVITESKGEDNMKNIQIGDTVMVVDKGELVEFLTFMLGEDTYEHGAELGETGVVVAKFGTTEEDGFEVDFGRVFKGNGKTTQAMKLSWIEKVEGGN